MGSKGRTQNQNRALGWTEPDQRWEMGQGIVALDLAVLPRPSVRPEPGTDSSERCQ